MPIYHYNITTTNSSSEGTIEAANKKEAEDKLTEQFIPKDVNYSEHEKDKDGNVVIDTETNEPKFKVLEHKLVNLKLEQIKWGLI